MSCVLASGDSLGEHPMFHSVSVKTLITLVDGRGEWGRSRVIQLKEKQANQGKARPALFQDLSSWTTISVGIMASSIRLGEAAASTSQGGA